MRRRQWHPNSSTLAWKIPWTEEPGRLQSMGSLRVEHDWVTSLSLFTFMHWRRKWQPTPVFLPGESQGCHLHVWGYWYFSWQSWFQPGLLPVQHFSWCTLHIGRFIPRYFILLVVMVNGIDSLISLLDSSLLVYRNVVISVYWPCILWLWWIHWLALVIFW